MDTEVKSVCPNTFSLRKIDYLFYYNIWGESNINIERTTLYIIPYRSYMSREGVRTNIRIVGIAVDKRKYKNIGLVGFAVFWQI